VSLTTEKQSEERRKDDLEQLQKLLLGNDRTRLNLLDKRVSDFESRASDVAEVLPDAFERIANDPVLEAELEKPMLRTIRASIKRDAPAFAEYLFPVMGPAIRRAVADALKSLLQRINVAMENSFTIKGLRWRLEAARSGIPFAQVVLRHTMRFAVQETFLIARDTGLVLAHAHRDENLILDEDAVAAMLTAIQSFIQDSLGISSDDPLRSAELGDRTLWVINGPDAILACIISGSPPRALRDELMALLESIHARYGERFDETDDALANDHGMRVLMHQSLRQELDDRRASSNRRKAFIYWAIAIIIVIALAGWKIWQENQQRQFEAKVVQLMKSQPGYIVSSSYREDGGLVIEGLRDPVTPSPEALMAGQSLPEQGLEFRFKPFLSLEPAIVVQNLRNSLRLTDSTRLTLQDGTLAVNGQLASEQAVKLTRLAGAHPLINTVDVSGTRLSAEDALSLARFHLDVPATVELEAIEGRIMVSGYSEITWYLEKSGTPREFGGWEASFEPLLKELQIRQRSDAEQLNGAAFFFTRQDSLSAESRAELDTFAQTLSAVLQSSAQLGIGLSITLIGQVDGTGTEEQNEKISQKRVKVVRDGLVESGIESNKLQSEFAAWSSGSENLSQRRVTVHVAEENHQ
jgi:outer membrane protein OmpA-like peptidoglycan-associated protein